MHLQLQATPPSELQCKPHSVYLPNSQGRNQCASYAHILFVCVYVCVCVCGWGGGLATDALFPLGAFALAHCEGDKNFLSYFQMKNNPTQNATGLC